MKEFGSNTRAPKKVQREEFALTLIRDGVAERHVFTAQPKLSVGEMLTAIAAQEGDNIAALKGVIRMIRRNLINNDGVPAQWEPEELPVPETRPALPRVADAVPLGYTEMADRADVAQWPQEAQPAVPEPLESSYRGPDGKIYPFSDAAKLKEFTAPEAGSSRRRWAHLLEQDDDVAVEAEDLVEIAQWMIGLATDRPTGPSAR